MPHLRSDHFDASRAFYGGVLGFEVAMDRRFFARDPHGNVVNILSHAQG